MGMDGVPVPRSLPTLVACSDDRVSALFDAHYERLYRLARRLAGSRDDALDLVQETYLRAAAVGDAVQG
jgi:DNA-directed RNA polymerase specialized sigma24 family protein